jgi:hypothetical protein
LNALIIKKGEVYMKRIGSLLFCFVFFAGVKLSAQITITQSDVQAFLTIGNTLESTSDTTTSSLNIGSTGATSWDFSNISGDVQTTFTCVTPGSTPFGSRFPSATACYSGETTIMGYVLNSYQYLGINNGLMNYGSGAEGTAGPFTITALIINNPSDKTIAIPLTMGTSWTEDYVETDSSGISGFPPTVDVFSVHKVNTVDAYGPMTLPGGSTVQALRLRTDQTENGTGFYDRYISYLFVTNSGTQVSVEAADTTSPSSGTIAVSGITYLNAGITGIRQVDNTAPDNFVLEQNYPNPFNPTTEISYSIPSAQKVVLKVYDELGRETATLVDREQAPGHYTVDFNASNFASGVYFYRLQAGDFVQMKKMILMK